MKIVKTLTLLTEKSIGSFIQSHLHLARRGMSPTKTIPLNRNLNQSNVTVILAATRTVQMADEMSKRTDLTRLDVIDLIRSIGEQ